MTEAVHGVMKAPCRSCPYRQDVPSGVWAEEEYDKLPGYDGDIGDQVQAGAFGLFLCHQRDNNLCAGWLATHGANNLLAMRLNGGLVSEEAWGYTTAVPVWASGREACDHGKRDLDRPGPQAERAMGRLLRQQMRRGDDA